MFKDCVTLHSIRSIHSTKCCFLVLRLCEAVGVYLWPQIAPITHFDFEPGPRSSEQSGPPHCIVRLINLQRAQSSFGSSPTPPPSPLLPMVGIFASLASFVWWWWIEASVQKVRSKDHFTHTHYQHLMSKAAKNMHTLKNPRILYFLHYHTHYQQLLSKAVEN